MIYVHVYSGLMSRCITMLHAYYLVKKYTLDQKMCILWEREPECNIGYYDVFDKEQFGDINVQVIDYSFRVKTGKGIKKSVSDFDVGGILYSCMMWILFGFKNIKYANVHRIIRDFKENGSYIDYQPSFEQGFEYDGYKAWQYENWKLVKDGIQNNRDIFISAFCGIIEDKEIDNIDFSTIRFCKQYYDISRKIIDYSHNIVGVHIRRTDHTVCIKYSLTEMFIDRINDILLQNPEMLFFLATDDKDVERNLKNRFGNHIIVNDIKTWGRDSKAGMRSAIIDELCLSECEYIIGSYTSVFSFFASKYGGKDLIICK